ncbi:transposase [Streptomyces sp. NPDC001435]|uniref:transposase n=1 Tax=unclassified Streptomyces TaxID=2593676 RepID=UPI0036CE7806
MMAGATWGRERDVIVVSQGLRGSFLAAWSTCVPPHQLALVSVLQFMEGLSHRHAAAALHGHIDWKLLLRLELTDPGFDNSVLGEFRDRLTADRASRHCWTWSWIGCERRACWYGPAAGARIPRMSWPRCVG